MKKKTLFFLTLPTTALFIKAIFKLQEEEEEEEGWVFFPAPVRFE